MKIFTDGAYSPTTKTGGSAFIIINGKSIMKYSKAFPDTSNNKMELNAIIMALRCIQKPIDELIVYTDSMYCIGCGTLGWKREKNIYLWKKFDKEIERVKTLCSNIEFKHIKGHNSDSSFETKWNNEVDKLAVQAREQFDYGRSNKEVTGGE